MGVRRNAGGIFSLSLVLLLAVALTQVAPLAFAEDNSAPVALDDPALETALRKVLASDGVKGDRFGTAVAIDGDTAVVGAYYEGEVGNTCGSAYVFVRSGAEWEEQQKLTAYDGKDTDHFGYSVAIDGDAVIVGAPDESEMGNNSGSAYVFVRSDTTWELQQKLTALDGSDGDRFGYSVAIDGDTAIAGALLDDDKGTDSGSAYVFVRSRAEWEEQCKLIATDGVAGLKFGTSIAIDGGTVIVAARFDDDKGTNSGSAYVFVRAGEQWTQRRKLTAVDGLADDEFGSSVAIDGGTAIVGARFDDDKGTDSGSAYVFVRVGERWIQQRKLIAADGAPDHWFGTSVAIDGDTAIVGACLDDDKGTNSGSAYVFVRSGTTWEDQRKLTAPDSVPDHWFGASVDIDGNTVIVGAYGGDDKGKDSGSAYFAQTTGGYTTDEGTQLTVPAPGVLGNDSDADGDPITAVLDADVGHGTLTLAADGSFIYMPDAGFNGVDSFMYKASDGRSLSVAAIVTITVRRVDVMPLAPPVVTIVQPVLSGSSGSKTPQVMVREESAEATAIAPVASSASVTSSSPAATPKTVEAASGPDDVPGGGFRELLLPVLGGLAAAGVAVWATIQWGQEAFERLAALRRGNG
ncbi:MAG: Ig-like domain-containing protein [Coriobacteriia bacterium]|nr:Ig-like domain-containing protein [Coriobacteriia bacterium]